MDFLDNLFTTRRKLACESRDHGRSDSRIKPEQVRLLLFKECDWRGRKLLFDSSTIVKVPAKNDDRPSPKHSETPCVLEVVDGYSYLYKGPAADEAILGEMIFGAVAMNHKGVSQKIHIMDEPKRLMCTKVFFVPAARRSSRVDRNSSTVDQSEPSDASIKPLRLQSAEEFALNFSFDRGDSGFYGEHSLHSSVSSTCDFFSMCDTWRGSVQDDLCIYNSLPGRKLSSSSASSWHRRTSRSLATKFDLGSPSSNLLEVPSSGTNFTSSDSQVISNSSASSTSDSLASCNVPSQRRNKLGLAFIITVADPDDKTLIRRCVEHSSQLAALVCRLRLAVLAASRLLPTLCAAVTMLATWLSDLMFGPRLQPIWLSLASQKGDSSMAEKLLHDLCSVLQQTDTKHTNFFFSALLTQVLTHHLGWVTSVSPYEVLDGQKHACDKASNSHPYNALWAQLNDLYGSIGFPPKATRTIIAGTTSQFVNRILIVLTYFIRCGEVRRRDFSFQNISIGEFRVTHVKFSEKLEPTPCESLNSSKKEESSESAKSIGLKRTATKLGQLTDLNSNCVFNVPEIRTHNNLPNNALSPPRKLVSNKASFFTLCDQIDQQTESTLRRIPTVRNVDCEPISLTSLKSEEPDETHKVLFVLGDDEKLVGLKNKSNNGKKVKRSSKIHNEPIDLDIVENGEKNKTFVNSREVKLNQEPENFKDIKNIDINTISTEYPESTKSVEKPIDSPNLPLIDKPNITSKDKIKLPIKSIKFDKSITNNEITSEENVKKLKEPEDRAHPDRNSESPSKCCNQTMQHSKPLKHSGFKFEFDKYPQIVTNYMKSKNLEILDRHYIGKPGNLKLDNFQFDPTIVPPIQEEKCETCYKCQMMESILQTPTNASELEYMNDMPRQVEPQFAKVSVVKDAEVVRELSPKTFVFKRTPNTLVVNVTKTPEDVAKYNECCKKNVKVESKKEVSIDKVLEFPSVELGMSVEEKCGFDRSLLGGVTDHYVPDLILQGTTSSPVEWENELRRDLDLTAYVNKSVDAPIQAVAIVGDTDAWEVKVLGRECRESREGAGGGGSALVGGMLDALPHMWRARVPPHQCLIFVESKLREFCVLSKTLADMLMSTDFCDMETLTKTLNIDINDVPLLMAVATTHTPQMARRYGISYR